MSSSGKVASKYPFPALVGIGGTGRNGSYRFMAGRSLDARAEISPP
jgi:hypothetical protein